MSLQYAKQQPSGYSNRLKNIAVVGAGGQIGGIITKELLTRGHHNVTAITRKDSTNKIPDGAKAIEVDYNDHASLVAAMKGQDCLIVTLAVYVPVDTSAKLFQAASEANVSWIIPNGFGTDSSDPSAESATRLQFESQRSVLEQMGLTWTGIACSFWYEFSLAGTIDRYGFDFLKKEVVFYDDGNTAIHTSTFPQVGRAVASLLALPILPEDEQDTRTTLSSFRNKFAHIASFRVSQKDMFASVLRVTQTKESDWSISYEPTKERFEKAKALMLAGDRVAFGRMLYARGFYPGDACMCNFDKYGLDNEVLGLPEEDFDEFTKVGVDMAHSDYFAARSGRFLKQGGNHAAAGAYMKKD